MAENARRGSVISIHVAPMAEAAMRSVPEARAVAGRGLEGDRYFMGAGTYSKTPGTGREVTLVEAEALEALGRDYGVTLPANQCRRNLVTRDIPLNHLVGKEFRVGEVLLRGMRLCEPCGHMDRLAGVKASSGLVHRGGLRAEIVRGGVIRAGDALETA